MSNMGFMWFIDGYGFSGANDGAAMPLLYLPLILMTSGPEALVSEWIISIWIKKILLSVLFGLFYGLAANRMLKYSQNHDLIDKQSFIAFSLALSVSKTRILIIFYFMAGLVTYNGFNEFDRL